MHPLSIDLSLFKHAAFRGKYNRVSNRNYLCESLPPNSREDLKA